MIDHNHTCQVVNELRLECAGKDIIGRGRSPAAVAWSLQRYLIFAILCCIPGEDVCTLSLTGKPQVGPCRLFPCIAG